MKMNADQTARIAQFLNGLDALTAQTDVRIDFHTSLPVVSEGEDTGLHIGAAQDSGGTVRHYVERQYD